MNLRSIKEIKNIRGKRVLVRVDFNIPLEHGKLADDTRIKAAAPTIKWLVEKGAKVILMSHFGQPRKKGLRNKDKGLSMIVERLGKLLKRDVKLIEEWDFATIGKTVKKMKAGQVFMLPNLRLHPGEEKNNEAFAKELANLGQIYVNEAFSVCHREHASIVGVPKFLPRYAGVRLIEEVETLGRVLHEARLPLIVLIGGAKITDKIAMIKTMTDKASAILVGGALANHFFKAQGYQIGASVVDPKGVKIAKTLLKNKKIILPRDVVVGTKDGKVAKVAEVTNESKALCFKPYAILDIGPKTILRFSHFIKTAQTLVWNGPMGLYEVKRFSHGTVALGRLFAARSKGIAFGVAGGGETIDALKKTGMAQYVDFISTGGGAMLEYLGGEELPGIKELSY
ncbi:phosphoglycerate kinase [Candidatus Uhrbacteria bacterium RIFCSPLOWO2_01_FULL_47_24]|uniref:Phosphoglycerate kinase n=1 Tax=Candidatus Uhrbacteria bacterium RIFCSPLOWO2_01_FULL_47_24 TaxID=1802401 RepID=A0A1F7UP61_9BACT|nr:MAG: phosphoglycerate kinase [Alphaproteobacteria bacterium RIFCSPHIGHO2_01_FULL_40_8]OGL67876.1 MAG: phosphoglycerate kinase [Candidatus Uhrbacteria bacterium RIFCSPHIGHO2_02_FULL_46_47]OGL75963.1 MAG: phosphoglycerate kinase [Candidatus Uhrbacteria bacterium RIFCSPHIGHO2_12_FULL_47_11]OGL80062.1 MAG: phosphoglycerate kinase [Candidatus Uhrbacteria bacterium RIFCSPLOWO2_01_FULL_47_24]OGL84848.1 MAG: phosphoglycerate kinase [Candidatus Uhrbacteria bacterium RIFCSPLOWO2_02_FULL_46_25]